MPRNLPHSWRLLAPLALLLAGASCDSPTAIAPPAAAARVTPAANQETAAQRWIALTRTIVGRQSFSPLAIARVFALVSVAQHDAVVAATQDTHGAPLTSEAGAVAGAASAILGALYPAEQAAIDELLAADVAYFAASPFEHNADYAAGVSAGRNVAAAVLARAATDRSDAEWIGTVPTGPGLWTGTNPLSPLWGQVRPWVMSSGDQFRPPPPPAFGSPEFQSAIADVRQRSDNLTPAQLEIAQFWQSGLGAGGPMGYFGDVASRLASAHNYREAATARMFALLYTAIMDASIGCWDAKFAYWYIRPFQADPAIKTPVGQPPFPSYPSAHSCLSSAAVGVLTDFFPEERTELMAQVKEAGIARLYAGLHYQFDVEAGQALGFSVAQAVLRAAPRLHEAIPLD